QVLRSTGEQLLGYEDRPVVVDVGARRAGSHQVAERAEKSVAVVLRKQCLCVASALHAVRRQHRAGVVLRAVDTVGVRGDGPDAAGLDSERQQKFAAAAAAT